MCGLGCKVFWSPWAQGDKPYDAVHKDDVDDGDVNEPVMAEPEKPMWSDMTFLAPIVKNKTGSVGNIRMNASYDDIATEDFSSKSNAKRNSVAIVGDSKNSYEKIEPKRNSAYEKIVPKRNSALLSETVTSLSKHGEKRNSSVDLNTSAMSTKALLKDSQLGGSTRSLADEKLHVMELVTTV